MHMKTQEMYATKKHVIKYSEENKHRKNALYLREILTIFLVLNRQYDTV